MSGFRNFWLTAVFAGALQLAQAGTLAQFRTIAGDLEVELYDQEKPGTTANFKRLVQSGAYQSTFFHRVVPGFVAQGGGFYNDFAGGTNWFGPPWQFVAPVPHFGQITNEFNLGPFLSNTNGTIAMAKVGDNPNSATCEWFFNLGNNATNLDNQNGGFTVFGRVVRDTGPTNTGGVLGYFNLIRYGNALVNLQWWYGTNDPLASLFKTLPVNYVGSIPPRYVDLFYVDISLLTVRITLTNNQREVSWNSVNGKTNLVEFTTVTPPAWQTLVATNGNGHRLAVPDPSATNDFRFYRVRVIY